MNESGLGLQAQPAHLLRARPPLQAFRELDEWLWVVDLGTVCGFSSDVKAQFFSALQALRFVREPEWIRVYSLEALAAGLFCGGLDAMSLYRQAQRPASIAHPVGDLLRQAIDVADTDWRVLEADDLQLQAGYGKHLNRATEEENVEFLTRPGAGDPQLQRALSETFRTGYSLGLIDAAIICLHNQTPEPI